MFKNTLLIGDPICNVEWKQTGILLYAAYAIAYGIRLKQTITSSWNFTNPMSIDKDSLWFDRSYDMFRLSS